MAKLLHLFAILIVVVAFPLLAVESQSSTQAGDRSTSPSADPGLTHRSLQDVSNGREHTLNPHRHMTLDVVVTDHLGRPVSGLKSQDFKIFDNGKPQAISSFQAVDDALQTVEPKVEIVFVIDTINSSFLSISLIQNQLKEFLQANGGHLAHPNFDSVPVRL